VGRVIMAGDASGHAVGDLVFVPGANCFQPLGGQPVRGLFGGAASTLVVAGARTTPVADSLGEGAVLLALAATAQHALAAPHAALPDLIVGHGVLGRLLARLTVAAGGSPVVWETHAARRDGAQGYAVIDPASDERRDYRSIYDVSGDSKLLDTLVMRLAAGGEIVLAGFYSAPLQFAFAPAFMREARLRVAAEWKPADLAAVTALLASGLLSLDGLITHREPAARAASAYRTAFNDASCLKMILDWRAVS
jgi:3-hydroxyethyl bacteriochlorophyllide a dehydrogenase